MKFALLVSHILDPMWVIPAVTMLGAYRMGLRDLVLWRFFVMMAMVMVVPPLVLRLRFAKEKGSSGWDIRNRAERPKAIGVLLALGVVNVLVAWTFGNASLGRLFIFYEVLLVGFFLISLVWKISGHAAAIALATGLVILWFGWAWWPALILVPLLAWARVVTKNHTICQVIAGALYSWVLLVVFDYYFML